MATRRIRAVPPLNSTDNVVVGNRVGILSTRGTLTPTLGADFTIPSNSLFIQAGGNATSVVRPVEIISVVDPGTSGAFCSVKEVDVNGVLAASGQTFTGVIPLPFRHFATVGMRGLYLTASAPSGTQGQRATANFVFLPIHGFGRFE